MRGTEPRPSIWFYVVAHSAFIILSIVTLGYAITVPSKVSKTAKIGIAYAAVSPPSLSVLGGGKKSLLIGLGE